MPDQPKFVNCIKPQEIVRHHSQKIKNIHGDRKRVKYNVFFFHLGRHGLRISSILILSSFNRSRSNQVSDTFIREDFIHVFDQFGYNFF